MLVYTEGAGPIMKCTTYSGWFSRLRFALSTVCGHVLTIRGSGYHTHHGQRVKYPNFEKIHHLRTPGHPLGCRNPFYGTRAHVQLALFNISAEGYR